jgi:hypothetical protein
VYIEDALEGTGFGFEKRALDSLEGTGFGFEKRALDALEGTGFGFDKRSLDSLDGTGFSGMNKRNANDRYIRISGKLDMRNKLFLLCTSYKIPSIQIVF